MGAATGFSASESSSRAITTNRTAVSSVQVMRVRIGDYRLLVIEYGLSDDISFHIPLSSFCR